MMKRWISIVLTGVLVLLLAACGTSKEDVPEDKEENKETEADSGSYEGESLVIWTNLTADAQYDVLNKQFTELADEMGIEVSVEKVAFNEMYEKLSTAAASGEVPDIMHTNFGGTAYLYAAESIMPMDDIMNEIGAEDFSGAYKTVLTGSDGHIYGLPDWAMHTSVWYRKDIFEDNQIEIPQDWDDFLAAAEKINTGEVSGFAVPLDGVQVAAQTLYEMMCSAGVYFMDPETGEYCFDKEKDEAVTVIEYLVSLYQKASPAGSLTWSWGDYRNALAVTGTCAMTLDMGAVIGNAQENNPDMTGKLGCFDFPGVDGKKEASFGSGYCFVASNQEGARKNLVSDFLTALYTPERAAERALSRPMFAFPSYIPSFDLYRENEKVADFKAEVDYIFDQFENSNWYWYGMEAGLSSMSAYIESTTIFGEALQGACDGTYSAEEAYDLINDDLAAFAASM